MRSLISTICLLFLCASAADAQSALSRDAFVKTCRTTPSNPGNNYPGESTVVKFNNLILPAGKSIPAAGQFIYLSGRVFDQHCIPLSGAKVELWQTNALGQYKFPSADAFTNPYPLFAGSGAAMTDNNGQFIFYTVFPGPIGRAAPHLNFRVTHANTHELATVMYFSGDQRNGGDTAFQRLPDALKPLEIGTVEPLSLSDPTQGLHVHYDMTVVGTAPYRRF